MIEITTNEDTGYATEKPITTRNFGIMGRQSNECRSGALTPSGVVERRSRRSPDMGSVRIPLSSRKYPNLFALIDVNDYDLVRQFSWSPAKREHTFYAQAYAGGGRKNRRVILLHRLLMDFPRQGILVDHLDGNGLNNTRANLRFASSTQNTVNARRPRTNVSGFKGVHEYRTGVWVASCGRTHLGYFQDVYEAASAYDAHARALYGPFARTNEAIGLFPHGDEAEDASQGGPIYGPPINGVYWDRQREKWVARIIVDGKRYYGGGFEAFSEAVKAMLDLRASTPQEGE